MTKRIVLALLASIAVVLLAAHGVSHAVDDLSGPDDDPCGGSPMMGDDDDDDDDGDVCGGGSGDDDDDDDDDDGGGGDTAGGDMAMERAPHAMTRPKGKLALWVDVGVNLTDAVVAKPFSIAPDLWYGVSDKLQVGLAHSSFGTTGFWVDIGQGVCLAGEDNGCPNLYSNFALLGDLAVMNEDLQVTVGGGLVKPRAFFGDAFDPLNLQLKAGAKARYTTGKFRVHAEPALFIGVTDRDFNKEQIALPVAVGYQVNPKIHAGAQTGIAGPLDNFGDFYQVPLAVGGMFAVSPKLGVGAAFSFLNIAGNNSNTDFRALSVYVAWHK